MPKRACQSPLLVSGPHDHQPGPTSPRVSGGTCVPRSQARQTSHFLGPQSQNGPSHSAPTSIQMDFVFLCLHCHGSQNAGAGPLPKALPGPLAITCRPPGSRARPLRPKGSGFLGVPGLPTLQGAGHVPNSRLSAPALRRRRRQVALLLTQAPGGSPDSPGPFSRAKSQSPIKAKIVP